MNKNFISNYSTTIKAPVEKVWDALTNPSIVKQYFFGSDLKTDWKVGNPIYFTGEFEGKPYQDKGVVLEFIPNDTLSFSYLSNWSALADLPENYLLIKYKVNSNNGDTELIVSQSNYDAEKAKHSEGNWVIVMDGLKKIVE